MTIELNTGQVILLIALVFLLMAGSLSVLVFILDTRKTEESSLDIGGLMELIFKVRKIAIILAIFLLLVYFVVYNLI